VPLGPSMPEIQPATTVPEITPGVGPVEVPPMLGHAGRFIGGGFSGGTRR
jgi:hypothetical protein